MRGSIRPCVRIRRFDREGVLLALTQTQLAFAVADRAEITRAEAKRVLGVLEEIVLEELGNAQKVRVGGLVQLTVRVKPAQKKRKGRNPATGEEIMIAAKPASVDVRARPLAKAKAALPSVQKARRRLAAGTPAQQSRSALRPGPPSGQVGVDCVRCARKLDRS